ncbi:predicted protein [Nematostella vectensis]|uniref:Uncharacterized protein n=1 Tax=Nematostella vectensis TaxID=45351 RepID=A7S8K6_NEMVE|nr:predicted protein [Nematostella vectensis]|eukprot:XP_001632068.1 predicted protein [Nematostella vectensis]
MKDIGLQLSKSTKLHTVILMKYGEKGKFYTKCKELVETKLFLLVRELLSRLSSKEKPEVTSTTWSLVASGLSAVGNVCRDAHARGRIAADQSWWRDLCGFMGRYSPSASSDASVCLAVHACLGLLANISSHSPALLQTKVDELMRSITALLPCRDEDILERSLAVLRFILASSENSIKIVRQEKLYVYFITALQSPRKSTTVRYALKCLAVCTQDDEDARQAVLQHGGIESLMGFFASEDEVTVGNAALCLSHCVLLENSNPRYLELPGNSNPRELEPLRTRIPVNSNPRKREPTKTRIRENSNPRELEPPRTPKNPN